MGGWRVLVLGGMAAGCFMTTTRPAYTPILGSPSAEVRLGSDTATERLAEALKADSIPVSRIEPRDGYLETPWFDASTGSAARIAPLGPDVVRVRGWVEPGRVGHSDIRVEVAYRPVRDPSVPGRDLERTVPDDHPVTQRVRAVLDSLKHRFGDPELPPVSLDTVRAEPEPKRPLPVKRAPPPNEKAPPDSGAPVKPDTAGLHPPRPDSTRRQTT
jgi:hypothetical protein